MPLTNFCFNRSKSTKNTQRTYEALHNLASNPLLLIAYNLFLLIFSFKLNCIHISNIIFSKFIYTQQFINFIHITDISILTTEYCMKVLCLARLLVPKADIRCAAGREVYFKGKEKDLLRVVDSIFASGYLTAGGQGIQDTIRAIEEAGFTYEIESA